MINRLVDWSVNNKLIVLVVVAIGCCLGLWSMTTIPIDATPDQGESQVIVVSHWDRSPDVMEDQVTYPIVSALLGTARVRTVRGQSDFGSSFVYVIFEDGTDPTWARAQINDRLAGVRASLPQGLETEVGPDATSLGWVFQYALTDSTHRLSLADLRSFQDWHLRTSLASVQGVAEVATVGGFTKQYQVNVDPHQLQAYGISLRRVIEAVRGGSSESGGRLLEFGGTEYMVRGRGYARSISDFQNIVLSTGDNGSIIRLKDVARVEVGPDIRRGVAELDGDGEVVSGIVIMRNGENALRVIDRVKARLHELEPGLPEGVTVKPIYDRSLLIRGAITQSKWVVVEVLVTVAVIILAFLWHFPSAIIPLITLPVTLLLCFIPFKLMGLSANIMTLAGIAIALGELVDASIIVVEQTHKRLEAWDSSGRLQDHKTVVLSAVKEVAGPTFFTLLVIAVSFLPVLTLQGQEGRMFRPLAISKTLAMVVAAILTLTLDPALRLLLTRIAEFRFRPVWASKLITHLLVGRIRSQENHPLTRWLTRMYEPAVRWSLRWKWAVIGLAAASVALTVPVFLHLGSELMPPLDEGSILYMPSTMPGISIAQAKQLLLITDKILKQTPEVDRVLGKAGRADSSTDPAPLSMLETVVTLKPRAEWRHVPTWYSDWSPEWVKPVLRHLTPDTISPEELVQKLDASLNVPGLSNAWNMPIKGRNDMLSTGVRTSLGLKVSGSDIGTVDAIASQVETLLAGVHGTRSVFAERSGDGRYIDVDWNRDRLAEYGVNLNEAQEVLQSAIGGENIATAIVGRERYPVNVRYSRDFRSDLDSLKRALVPSSTGRLVELGQVSEVRTAAGPAMIRDEDAMLTGYVFLDIAGTDPERYIKDGQAVLREKIHLPAGYTISWSGQYESMERVRRRLGYVVPLTLALVFLLLFINTRSLTKTLIVLLAVPFSAVGAIWFLYLAGYNMSAAVWVGLIALLGVDAETGVFMLLYLDLAYDEAKRQGRLHSLTELREAIVRGAAKRLRPKFMTFATTCIGLLPIMWANGVGSDVMKRIAAPMIGGILTSFLLELLVYPGIYEVWRWHTEVRANVLEQDSTPAYLEQFQ